jgi:hypothetical protein
MIDALCVCVCMCVRVGKVSFSYSPIGFLSHSPGLSVQLRGGRMYAGR